MDLKGKTIAITGATGGLGKCIAFELAKEQMNFVFISRNVQKSSSLEKEIKNIFPGATTKTIVADLENIESVRQATRQLAALKIDFLLLNAGIYNVKLRGCDSGYNNIFTVNFVSQYYMARKLLENGSKIKKVVAVGSIAHKHKALDGLDIDYSSRKAQSKIYGNSKKFLMYSMETLRELFPKTEFAIAHPGITHTNMTSHYPKAINWFVDFGIKLIFPSPKKACLSILQAIKHNSTHMEWFGPRFFDIYGKSIKTKLKYDKNELVNIKLAADVIYNKIDNQ